MQRVYNFAAGPSTMPEAALRTAADELLCFGTTGMSVMEMSHRSKMYLDIFDEDRLPRARAHECARGVRPCCFCRGGAMGQFAAVPMNLIGKSGKADYIDSGKFRAYRDEGSRKVRRRAAARPHPKRTDIRTFPHSIPHALIRTRTICTSRPTTPSSEPVMTNCPIPAPSPLVADMSSNILSEVYDVTKFRRHLCGGAQKNIGPAGFALVIVKKGNCLAARCPLCPASSIGRRKPTRIPCSTRPRRSPSTWLACASSGLKDLGGVPAIEKINIEKAKILYDAAGRIALLQNPS